MPEPTHKILITLENGGVSQIYATIPIDIVIQDYDIERGSEFADASNPGRQTTEFSPETGKPGFDYRHSIEIVSQQELDAIIHEDDRTT